MSRSIAIIDDELKRRRALLVAARERRDVPAILAQQDKISDLLDERFAAHPVKQRALLA